MRFVQGETKGSQRCVREEMKRLKEQRSKKLPTAPRKYLLCKPSVVRAALFFSLSPSLPLWDSRQAGLPLCLWPKPGAITGREMGTQM